MPLLSIVIPVYNLDSYLERCVNSIQHQSLEDWELILVDDCSEDSSLEIIKRLAASDNRIKYIKNAINRGPMISRELGYKAAHGQYITFVDGDDTLPLDSLMLLYEDANQSNADIVVGDIIVIEQDGSNNRFRKETQYGIFTKKEIMPSLLNRNFPHNLCAKLFKSELFKSDNIKNTEGYVNGEDGLLFYQLLDNVNTISVINNTVYYYWMNSTSSTHKLNVSETMIKGTVELERIRYDLFIKELPNCKNMIYAGLYTSVSNSSMIFPLNNLLDLYKNAGLILDVRLKNLSKYFKGKELCKIFIKTHYGYFLKKLICHK